MGQTIVNANNGDTINLDTGTYTNNVTNITINKNLTIQGKNQKNTIIDAQKFGNIFKVESGNTLTLINITLINSNITDYTLHNFLYGAVIYNEGTVKITNCAFINNTAYYGGVIYNSRGNISIINSNFINNTASTGGAISNVGGNIRIINSNFINNTAVDDYGGAGGAIFNVANGDIGIINSNFINNIASDGGAIYSYFSSMTINGSNFTGNTADNNGGAMVLTNSTDITINNSIFKNNYANNGSAIYKGYDCNNLMYNRPADLTIINSNFTDNKGGATIHLNGTNTTITGSNIFNNSQGILAPNDTNDVVINYNRIFNNTNNTGYNLDNYGTNINADLNWWGDNNPLVNGVTLGNYFLMKVINATSLNTNGTVTFHYTFGLNTGENANNSLLPYFVTDVYTNVTNGIIKSFDARFDRMFDITLNSSGNVLYTFITDNEIQSLEGIVTIIDPVDPVDPNEPVDPNNPLDPDNGINKTINDAVAAMKKTGMPISLILLVLCSLVGFGYYRKH